MDEDPGSKLPDAALLVSHGIGHAGSRQRNYSDFAGGADDLAESATCRETSMRSRTPSPEHRRGYRTLQADVLSDLCVGIGGH